MSPVLFPFFVLRSESRILLFKPLHVSLTDSVSVAPTKVTYSAKSDTGGYSISNYLVRLVSLCSHAY